MLYTVKLHIFILFCQVFSTDSENIHLFCYPTLTLPISWRGNFAPLSTEWRGEGGEVTNKKKSQGNTKGVFQYISVKTA